MSFGCIMVENKVLHKRRKTFFKPYLHLTQAVAVFSEKQDLLSADKVLFQLHEGAHLYKITKITMGNFYRR